MSLISITDLNNAQVDEILEKARAFSKGTKSLFQGKLLVNLFYEPSTRTSASFSIAAERLGMQILNIGQDSSSIQKGESLQDTIRTLSQYDPAVIVLRHPHNGAAQLARDTTTVPIVNAGDGTHQHPTQALSDLYVLKAHYPSLEGLPLAMVGDLLYSRVARSNLELFKRYRLDLTLCGPPSLLPKNFLDCKTTYRLEDILDAQVIYVLRFQNERRKSPIPFSLSSRYQITAKHLKDSYLMHPGPANRGVEVTGEALDHPNSLVLEQVRAGLFVRLAVISWILENQP